MAKTLAGWVGNLPHTPAVGRLETCPTLFRRSRSCRIERHPEKMKINHEETDSHRSSLFFLRFLRFFVVDFPRSRLCRIERHPEKMKINHEETKSTKKR